MQQKGARSLLPADDVRPLIDQDGKIAVALHPLGIHFTDDRLGRGAHDQRLVQLFAARMRDDGDFGREPLHVLRLPLQIALGDQHGEIGVFDALRPKALIHLSLYILPDPIAVRANDHRSLDGAVVDELGLDDDVRIPGENPR